VEEAPSPPAQPKTPQAPEHAPPAQAVPVAGGFALRVSVDSVFLNVSVRDRQTNRSIPDLEKGDFEVYEDGKPQRIEQLATGDAPFNLLLLLDVSGSTRSFLPLMKQASVDFTRQIKPNDRIAIAAFNSQVELMQDFTNDRTEAIRAIGRLSSSGGTAFYDALLMCIDHYMRGIEGRSAIVVFTDGVDNQLEGRNSEGSRTLFSQLYRRIQEIDPIIYTIFLDTERQSPVSRGGGVLGDILGGVLGGGRRTGGYPGPNRGASGNPAIYDEARDQLLTIAEQTGGRLYSPNRIEDLSRVYAEIADDLRIQYQLGYNSTNRSQDGRWREIRVQVLNRPDAVVRTRRGYLARTEKEGSRIGGTNP
jgi:Ca-activated chloride channel family protein